MTARASIWYFFFQCISMFFRFCIDVYRKLVFKESRQPTLEHLYKKYSTQNHKNIPIRFLLVFPLRIWWIQSVRTEAKLFLRATRLCAGWIVLEFRFHSRFTLFYRGFEGKCVDFDYSKQLFPLKQWMAVTRNFLLSKDHALSRRSLIYRAENVIIAQRESHIVRKETKK